MRDCDIFLEEFSTFNVTSYNEKGKEKAKAKAKALYNPITFKKKSIYNQDVASEILDIIIMQLLESIQNSLIKPKNEYKKYENFMYKSFIHISDLILSRDLAYYYNTLKDDINDIEELINHIKTLKNSSNEKKIIHLFLLSTKIMNDRFRYVSEYKKINNNDKLSTYIHQSITEEIKHLIEDNTKDYDYLDKDDINLYSSKKIMNFIKSPVSHDTIEKTFKITNLEKESWYQVILENFTFEDEKSLLINNFHIIISLMYNLSEIKKEKISKKELFFNVFNNAK